MTTKSEKTGYALGLDFGTEEARGLLLDMRGRVVASAAFVYPHGVMTDSLPDGTPLGSNFALQHPRDYIDALHRIIPALLAGGVDKKEVIGIGVDFTQCTMMPLAASGEPLCFLPEFAGNPYAYAKLWRHHGGQPQAEKLSDVARRRGEAFLANCGGEVYAESMFPKVLETYERAPEVYRAADAFTELADWIPLYLTGTRRRSRSIAGCAALWHPQRGYPGRDYFAAMDAGFADVVRDKFTDDLVSVGAAVGVVGPEMAARLGLAEGTPVAAGLGDCQAAFVGAGLVEEHVMLTVMGTSSCDMLVSGGEHAVPGVYGVSYDSILPGLFGYEAGQATMGDLFRWFSQNWVPREYEDKARADGMSVFDYMNRLAQAMRPGETGLVALDWWSGNRSVLLDADLAGMVLGLRMGTRPQDVYRALVEALAFGKRRIVEQFNCCGVEVRKLYATGGVAVKNPYLMQTLADVCGIPVHISASDNGSCVGSAIYGAAAAGPERSGYRDLYEAACGMGADVVKTYAPDPALRPAYEVLYDEYKTLYQYFGRENLVMKRLLDLKKGGAPC